MLVWLLAFIGLWTIFQSTLPLNTMKYQLDKIEQSIVEDDWQQAIEYTAEFKDIFNKKRFFIQINNATEAFTVFEHTIGQLEVTVKNNQESSLEYIGALREILNLVIKPFSGP